MKGYEKVRAGEDEAGEKMVGWVLILFPSEKAKPAFTLVPAKSGPSVSRSNDVGEHATPHRSSTSKRRMLPPSSWAPSPRPSDHVDERKGCLVVAVEMWLQPHDHDYAIVSAALGDFR